MAISLCRSRPDDPTLAFAHIGFQPECANAPTKNSASPAQTGMVGWNSWQRGYDALPNTTIADCQIFNHSCDRFAVLWLSCSNHQETRDVTDDIFHALLKNNGVSDHIADAIWLAVKTAGGLFLDNDDDDQEMLTNLRAKLRSRPNFSEYVFPVEIVDRDGEH